MTTRKTTPLLRRDLATELRPAGSRRRKAVIATSNPVQVYDWQTGRLVREVLLMSGAVLPGQCPLLADHDRSVRSLVGSATNFRVVGDAIEADLAFASGTAAADEVWTLASQDHLRAVSVGYRVLEARELRAGQTETIDGRTYTGPCRLATRWSLHEVSVVPIGADPAALLRSAPFSVAKDVSMPDLVTPSRDVSHLCLRDYCAAYVAGRDDRVPESDRDMLQRFAAIGGYEDLVGRINVAVLDGFNAEADSTAGWTTAVPLPNFLESRLAVVSTPAQAIRLGRGEQAAPAVLATQYQGWRLMRVGLSFTVSDEDVLDSAGTIDTLSLALREMGAALRRTVIDAVYGLLLENPVMSDGGELFSVTRGNLGTAAIGTTSLAAAWSAIAGYARQVTPDVACYAHSNLQPGFLVTTPSKFVTAVTTVSGVWDTNPLVRPRCESRLSATAFLDPRTNTVRSGGDGYWLLAVPASQAPTVVLGFLNGRREPRVRSYALSAGRWGRGFDIELSFGVTCASAAGLYLSTGTA